MTIRWRLGAFVLQLGAIVGVARWATGHFLSAETWFSSLVALAINSQLLEPYFPRPVDVLANAVVALLLYFLSPKTIAAPGWSVLAVALVSAMILSGSALLLGAGRTEGRLLPVARVGRVLSGAFSAVAIYSA